MEVLPYLSYTHWGKAKVTTVGSWKHSTTIKSIKQFPHKKFEDDNILQKSQVLRFK